jgi:hypothetical protein
MAAEIPWPVDRYRVGKHSPGTINVVVFGPALNKNWPMMYKASKAPRVKLLYANPRMQKRMVRRKKPITWSGLRPKVSIVKMAVQ